MTARGVGHFFLPLTGIVMVGLIWLMASRSIPMPKANPEYFSGS